MTPFELAQMLKDHFWLEVSIDDDTKYDSTSPYVQVSVKLRTTGGDIVLEDQSSTWINIPKEHK